MNVTNMIRIPIFIGLITASPIGAATVPAMPTLGCEPGLLRKLSLSRQAIPQARSPEDLLAVLRKIHDEFLLTDADFTADEATTGLFGQGAVRRYPSVNRDDVLKEVMTAPQNGLHTNFLFSYSAEGMDRRGWIYMAPQTIPNEYSAELVEKLLTAGIVGQVPLADPPINGTEVQGGVPSGRPFLTHPKGYFQYEDIKESDCFSSSLTVRLNRDGTLRDVQIEQRQRGDYPH